MRQTLTRSFAHVVVLAAGLMGGCAAKSRQASIPVKPFSGDQLEALRASYKNAFPNASVGVVTAVMPEQPYALVGQIETVGIPVGSILTFIDASETVITNGKVVLVNATGLTVQFDEGKRRPVVGDAAIRF